MRFPRWFQALLAATLALLSMAACVAGQSDTYTVSTRDAVPPPPGRAGRLADFSGTVWIYEQDRGEWIEAVRNRPLTSGDRVSTGNDARAELRIGSTIVRMDGRSELEVAQLDDQRLLLQLVTGGVALRVRTREWAEEIQVLTPEVRLRPLQAGHYRIDRIDDASFAGSWRGELLVDENPAFPIATGQRMEFWRERGGQLRHRWSALPADALQAWAVAEDQRDERTAYSRYVSPEMTGAEELDRHGRWEQAPEYGAIWFPLGVQIGWAPYQFGRWVWMRHWGWIWVDNQPWGFAPFHYGRWVQWRGRWGWVPGVYVPRPVFTPTPRPPHAGRPYPPPPHVGRPHPPAQPPLVRPPHEPPSVHPPGPPASMPAPRPRPPWVTPPRDRSDKPERPDRPERGERQERPERQDRIDRPSKSEPATPPGLRGPQPERNRPTPQPVTLPTAPVAAPAAPTAPVAPAKAVSPAPVGAQPHPTPAQPPGLRLPPPRRDGEARLEKPADRGDRREPDRDEGRKKAPDRPGLNERERASR